MNYLSPAIKTLFLLPILLFMQCGKNNKAHHKAEISQEITINIEKDPTTLDGRKSTLLRDFNIIRTFNEGLYRINKQGELAEAIAESCTILPDQKTYIIKLKQTQWSDGTPLTAHHFIDAWKSILEKDFPAPSASLLYPLKNAKAIKEGRVPVNMLGAHTQGAYTIVVELEKETPYFKELLSLPVYFPLGESSLNNISENKHLCNGPFYMTSRKIGNEITAVKNKRYWDKDAVKIKKLNMIIVDQATAFNMYQNNELHLIGAPYSHIPPDALNKLREQDALKTSPMLRTHLIRVNTSAKILKNKHFRRSLALAINRKGIVDFVLSGGAEVATGIVPESMGLQDVPYFKDADTKEALAALNTACKEERIQRKNIPTLTFSYFASGNNHKIAAALQDGWHKELGINIQLEPLEQKVYLDKISKGNFELASGAWAADFDDPINFLEIFKTKDSASNYTGWESPDYIKAIESSYLCSSHDDRKMALAKAEQILIDEMVAIPVYHYSMLHLQDEKLKGVVKSQTGILDLKWAYLSE